MIREVLGTELVRAVLSPAMAGRGAVRRANLPGRSWVRALGARALAVGIEGDEGRAGIRMD